MVMSEKELEKFLSVHSELILDTKTNAIRKRTKNDTPLDIKPDEKSKTNKYRNIKMYEYKNGIVLPEKNEEVYGKIVTVYDSMKEYHRWLDLQLLQRAGEISNLVRQHPLVIQKEFEYQGKKSKSITYKADFVYTMQDGRLVIEDVKTFDKSTGKYRLTKEFALKWKLLKAQFPDYEFKLY